jgi:hypothetical protein
MIKRLNEVYFGGKLSSEAIEILNDIEKQDVEVQTTVERMFGWMNESKFRAQDFSPSMAWQYGFLLSRIHPQTWGGMIPPITIQGRHRIIDEYISSNPWASFGPGITFLDLGCGFPPLTTLDTARRFPDWQIVGADPSFGRYIVSNSEGDYACFEANKKLRYFQPCSSDAARWDLLHRDRSATITNFTKLLDDLLTKLPSAEDHELLSLEDRGNKLVKNPVREFETSNLRFIQKGIGEANIDDVSVVRCFNVLLYFDRQFRHKMLRWLSEILVPGGLFVCGVDWAKTSLARYTIYRNENDRMIAKEFAFSIDNIRPLGMPTWLAYNDRDLEATLLTRLVGAIRSDKSFRERFDDELDGFLEKSGLCKRNKDGYLGSVEIMPPAEMERRSQIVIEELDRNGFIDGVVEVLHKAGWNAWRNRVGHIAVTPPLEE